MLEAADDATLAGARVAAGLLDAALADPDESRYTVARLLAELGAWHDRLRDLAAGGGDQLDQLLRELSAPVGDPSEP